MDKLYKYIFLFTSSRVDDGKKMMRYDYEQGGYRSRHMGYPLQVN